LGGQFLAPGKNRFVFGKDRRDFSPGSVQIGSHLIGKELQGQLRKMLNVAGNF
jgi:hypothetical protein